MKISLRLSAIVVLGLLAPLWCSWSFSRIYFWILIAAGMPLRPSLLLSWAVVLGVPLALGLLVGGINHALLPGRPWKGWAVFWISLLIGAALLSLAYGAPAAMLSLLGNPGTWSFAVGSAVTPAILNKLRRKRDASHAA